VSGTLLIKILSGLNMVGQKTLYVAKLSEVEGGISKEKLPSLCRLVCDE
jgi:hypothetical protein